MAYWTVKCVLSDVPFPGSQCSKFLRLTEERRTLLGLGREEEPEEKDKIAKDEKHISYKLIWCGYIIKSHRVIDWLCNGAIKVPFDISHSCSDNDYCS